MDLDAKIAALKAKQGITDAPVTLSDFSAIHKARMKKTLHTNQPNATKADSNEWPECYGSNPILDCIIHVRNVIDGHICSMDNEELWRTQRSITRLKAFLFILPERTVHEILKSPAFSMLDQTIMEEWAESLSPLDGWPGRFLNQLAGL